MSAPWLMVLASLLFATMGACVKVAATQYGSAEIVFYRGLIGAGLIVLVVRWRGGTLRTRLAGAHLWRSLTGVTALCLWFFALGHLPLATAMTLNYMSSVWMALFLVGAALMLGRGQVDTRTIATVLLGFVGVVLILRPTVERQQLWHGLMGLLSGMVSATAYLQIAALGRAGEPEYRIVFYFSLGGIVAGALLASGLGWHAHTATGIVLLFAVGLLATVAQLLMTRAYAIGRPLVNACLQYLGIAFSFGFGVLLFDDPVSWSALGGMALVVVAGVQAARLRGAAHPALPSPD